MGPWCIYGSVPRARTHDDRRRRSQIFPVRLSPLERAVIGAAAEQAGETAGGFVRRAAMERAVRITRNQYDDPDDDNEVEDERDGAQNDGT